MKTNANHQRLRHTAFVRLAIIAVGLAFGAQPVARGDILYVGNTSDDTLRKFTSGGVGSTFATTNLAVPYGLAFDSAGNLYVANNQDGTIMRFTSGGVGSLFASTGGVGPTARATFSWPITIRARSRSFPPREPTAVRLPPRA